VSVLYPAGCRAKRKSRPLVHGREDVLDAFYVPLVDIQEPLRLRKQQACKVQGKYIYFLHRNRSRRHWIGLDVLTARSTRYRTTYMLTTCIVSS